MLKSGERVVFRSLETKDKERLLAFLGSFSTETKNKFGLNVGEYITCPEMLHMVLVNQASDIIGYIILSLKLRDSQMVRYKEYEITVVEGRDICIALVIADRYQGKGAGSILLTESVKVAKSLGAKYIILWQGTQLINIPAICLYEKFGFTRNGEFEKYGHQNIDMTLIL
ncbi:MAG: GNAT family N-acetyltransferase [Patescibacteria group bacterium]